MSDILEDEFDEDIAKAAKSNQVSQFGGVLDEIDDLSEDDEVISEFLQGLDDGVVKSPVDQYSAEVSSESDAENPADDDLFDELFDEDDVYESTQAQETKDSILKAIRDNPISEKEQQAESRDSDDDLDLFGNEDFDLGPHKVKKESSRSSADVEQLYSNSKISMLSMVGSIVGVICILGLAGYSYLLQRDITGMKKAMANLEMGVTEPDKGVDPIKVAVLEGQVKTLVKRMSEVEVLVAGVEENAGASKGVPSAVSEELTEQSEKMKTLSRTVASMVQDIMKLESGIEVLQKAPKVVVAQTPVAAKKAQSKTVPNGVSNQPRKTNVQKPWVVNIASFAHNSAATRALKMMHARGIDAKKLPVKVKGKTWYRLRVTGFETQALASKYMKKLSKVPGLTHPWITKR